MTREPCDCEHDGSAWTHMCELCAADFNARHLRAQKEKDAADLLGCYYLIPDSRDQPKQE